MTSPGSWKADLSILRLAFNPRLNFLKRGLKGVPSPSSWKADYTILRSAVNPGLTLIGAFQEPGPGYIMIIVGSSCSKPDISANTGFNFNPGFFIFCSKVFFFLYCFYTIQSSNCRQIELNWISRFLFHIWIKTFCTYPGLSWPRFEQPGIRRIWFCIHSLTFVKFPSVNDK